MPFSNISTLIPELVVWEDIAQCPETWASRAEIEDWLSDGADAHVEQLGFVIYEDDHIIVITDSIIDSMELFGNVNKIPKSCIISRKQLTEK